MRVAALLRVNKYVVVVLRMPSMRESFCSFPFFPLADLFTFITHQPKKMRAVIIDSVGSVKSRHVVVVFVCSAAPKKETEEGNEFLYLSPVFSLFSYPFSLLQANEGRRDNDAGDGNDLGNSPTRSSKGTFAS